MAIKECVLFYGICFMAFIFFCAYSVFTGDWMGAFLMFAAVVICVRLIMYVVFGYEDYMQMEILN